MSAGEKKKVINSRKLTPLYEDPAGSLATRACVDNNIGLTQGSGWESELGGAQKHTLIEYSHIYTEVNAHTRTRTHTQIKIS